ncbi:MAG: cupin domain-containing protein [Anaerolineales bacterium]
MVNLEPETKTIKLDTEGESYKNLLREGVTSHVLHSGLVELTPGNDVGEHSSKDCEELIVPLSGEGQMVLKTGNRVDVTPENAIYCPPWTVHNVINTGETTLRYVYIVAKTGEKSNVLEQTW